MENVEVNPHATPSSEIDGGTSGELHAQTVLFGGKQLAESIK
jgi:hypothetical protein